MSCDDKDELIAAVSHASATAHELRTENERLRATLDRVRALCEEWRWDGEMGLRDYVATMADMLAAALDTPEGEKE